MFAQTLSQMSVLYPDVPAVLDSAGAHTWRNVNDIADRLTHALATNGIRSGVPVMVLLPQSGAALALLAACDAARVPVLPVPALYGEAQARQFQTATGIPYLVGLNGDTLVLLSLLDPPAILSESADDTAEVLLLTSGSSGTPKCVCHTWRTLAGAVVQRETFVAQRWLLGYPIGHFAGMQVVLQSWLNGGTLVVPADFRPQAALHALREQQPAYLTCTPTYLRQLLLAAEEPDLTNLSLRQITLGGEIADQTLFDWVATRLPTVRVIHIYASTELGILLTVRDGRAGFAAALLDEPDSRLKIVDGELWARRSPQTMLGYRGHHHHVQDDVWLATGDLVEVRGDRVYFLGRRSDTINVGGFKVQPAVVEHVIRSVVGVRDVCVMGKANSIVGQLVQAVLWVAPGSDQQALRVAVLQHCREQLPDHMHPRLLTFTTTGEELARTVSQKLLRQQRATP